MTLPLKILLVSEDLPARSVGGLGKHVLMLARALAEAGHSVDVMGNAEFSAADGLDPLELPGRFIPLLHGSQAGWKERRIGAFVPLKRAVIARRFARCIMNHADHYDVVHYHGHVPDLAAYIPAAVNFVQTRHDQGSDCLMHTRFRNGVICNETSPRACASCMVLNPNALQFFISEYSVRDFRERVVKGFIEHKTIFVSEFLKKNAERTLGSESVRAVKILHHFIDGNFLERAVLPSKTDDGVFRIFVAGKLYAPKGIDQFLAELMTRLPDRVHIEVAGDGPQEDELRLQYRDDSRISFRGWCSPGEVLSLMALADAVVVPSVCEEAFGGTTVEALSLGRPVYALERGATPELKIYEVYESQLKLFPSMHQLVDQLCTLEVRGQGQVVRSKLCDVRNRLPELLAIYRA